jgi:hypothetical protein
VTLAIRYPLFGSRDVISTSATFDAYTIDADGVYARVSQGTFWSSSDTRVLTANGSTISFRQTGDAFVIGTYQGLVGTLPVSVRPATDRNAGLEIQSIGSSVSTKPVTLYAGGAGSTVTASVAWASSDERIATVNERGVVTGIAPGNVRISATLNGLSDFFWMSVAPRTHE